MRFKSWATKKNRPSTKALRTQLNRKVFFYDKSRQTFAWNSTKMSLSFKFMIQNFEMIFFAGRHLTSAFLPYLGEWMINSFEENI